MTEEERSAAVACIADYVRRNDHVTFVEIGRRLAELDIPTEGEFAVSIVPNAVLWADMSQEFVDIIHDLQEMQAMHLVPSTALVYMIDGGMVNLPIAKRVPAGGYRKPHWVPVTFRPGRDPSA